jgi:ribonuclease PH
MRIDGRALDALRPFSIEPGFIKQAHGSALVTAGETRVICTASVQSRTPKWLSDGGWVTAEYAMLPGATGERGRRDPGGRGKEIQRLIGRSLRQAVDLSALKNDDGGISIICDCDVIEADGGTRTASITGAYVALSLAIKKLLGEGRLSANPMRAPLAAVSVGIVPAEGSGTPTAMLDLPYHEDSRAIVDFNVVMRQEDTGPGLVEVQGTGEDGIFSRSQLNEMLDLAETGFAELVKVQRSAIEAAG